MAAGACLLPCAAGAELWGRWRARSGSWRWAANWDAAAGRRLGWRRGDGSHLRRSLARLRTAAHHTPCARPLAACSQQGVKLTEKERRDLEYKEQVYRLAVERKQQLGAPPRPAPPLHCARSPRDAPGRAAALLRAGRLLGIARCARSLPLLPPRASMLPVLQLCLLQLCLPPPQRSWSTMIRTTCPLATRTKRGAPKSTRC